MSSITLQDAVGSPRATDALPWSSVRILGGATEDGTFTVRETQELSLPLDDDPSDPRARTLTTDALEDTDLWVQLQFLDADLDEDLPTAPVEIADLASTQARDRIARFTNATEYPELDADDLDELVMLARRSDADGVHFSDTDWTPTYDVYAAAALGWEIKAGKAAGDFRFAEDGQSFSREQVFEHCMQMAKTFRKGRSRATRTVTLESPYSGPAVESDFLLDFGEA